MMDAPEPVRRRDLLHSARNWKPSSVSPKLGALAPQIPYNAGRGLGRVRNAGEKSSASPQPAASANQAPYYADRVLGKLMYRGPGYESFPVVLGTVQGHQEICDKWDMDQANCLQRKAVKMTRALFNTSNVRATLSESGDDSDDDEVMGPNKQCLAKVLEVFPSISHTFVLRLFRAHRRVQHQSQDQPQLGVAQVIENVIAEILEMKAYPKESVINAIASGKGAAADGTGITITWDRSMDKDEVYQRDAAVLLAKSFAHVPMRYILQTVVEKKSIFDAYVHIHQLEDKFFTLPEPRPYARLKKARLEVESQYTRGLDKLRLPAEYGNRVNELQAAKQHVARALISTAAKKAKEESEAQNLAEHVRAGALITCQCCFDDEVPLNRVVSCSASSAHFFCFECMERLAETQIGMLKHQMSCMDESGCDSEFSRQALSVALSIQNFDRLQLNKQQAAIKAADIQGLEDCPFCDYQAVCGTVEDEPIFSCMNPQCGRDTCRKCQKESHTPKTCEEYQKETAMCSRRAVEEARSEAIMRTCPKCKVKIVKEFGCNKLVCANCQTLMCYECKADLTKLIHPYDHFNSQDATCSLYDLAGLDRHETEANAAETEAIKQAKMTHANLDEADLRVETGKAKEPAWYRHPAAGVLRRDMNNRAGRLSYQQIQLNNMSRRVTMLQQMQMDKDLQAHLDEVYAIEEERDPDGAANREAQLDQRQPRDHTELQALLDRIYATERERDPEGAAKYPADQVYQVQPYAPTPKRERQQGNEANLRGGGPMSAISSPVGMASRNASTVQPELTLEDFAHLPPGTILPGRLGTVPFPNTRASADAVPTGGASVRRPEAARFRNVPPSATIPDVDGYWVHAYGTWYKHRTAQAAPQETRSPEPAPSRGGDPATDADPSEPGPEYTSDGTVE